jgi:hypothetical protein
MLDDANATIDLAGKLEFLSRPQNYPDRPGRVETIETHMSWVFLTERFAYKLKKPVRLAFLDFSTLAARKHACDESLRLNARLAGDVYVGVVALRRRADGELSLDGDGEPVAPSPRAPWIPNTCGGSAGCLRRSTAPGPANPSRPRFTARG